MINLWILRPQYVLEQLTLALSLSIGYSVFERHSRGFVNPLLRRRLEKMSWQVFPLIKFHKPLQGN